MTGSGYWLLHQLERRDQQESDGSAPSRRGAESSLKELPGSVTVSSEPPPSQSPGGGQSRTEPDPSPVGGEMRGGHRGVPAESCIVSIMMSLRPLSRRSPSSCRHVPGGGSCLLPVLPLTPGSAPPTRPSDEQVDVLA